MSFYLPKAEKTLHHVCLYDHTSLFTLTIETYDEIESGSIQNMNKGTRENLIKLKAIDLISASYSQTPTEQEEGERGLVWLVRKQQYDKM